MVDLDGDGLADVLITGDDAFTWYPGFGYKGFGAARRAYHSWGEEHGPRLMLADPEQTIYLADMSGDGLSDLVRLRDSEVCYWPNLGFGRFGAKVTMDGCPWLDEPGREHFPYLPGHRDVRITRIELFFQTEDPDCVAGHVVTFVAEHEREHGRDEECRCAGHEIECAAGPEWPCLYHGTLDCDLPPLRQGCPRDIGDFRLSLPGREIRQMFLIVGYEAVC
jgi:hypothetical protein